MQGINTPEITLPPGDAVTAAILKAEQIGGPCNYRLINHAKLRLMTADAIIEWVDGKGAVIIALHDGYAVHTTCERGIGPIVARIRNEGYQR